MDSMVFRNDVEYIVENSIKSVLPDEAANICEELGYETVIAYKVPIWSLLFYLWSMIL